MASKLSPAPKRGPAPKGQPKPVGGNKPSSGSKGAVARAPITRVSVSTGKTERSVSVREIENGYLVNECTYGPNGYKERTTYSKTAPKIDVAAIAKSRK